MLDGSARKPGQFAVRDTIGTLLTLSIEFIALFPPLECYGGAPRGERVPLDARRASPGVDGRASRARQQKTCAFRRSARPSWGRMEKRETKPGRSNAPRERRRLRCLTL